MPGFRVAGKTSTAQKVDPATGQVLDGEVHRGLRRLRSRRAARASSIAVVLDEPMIGHYGGDLAGPVFRRVAEASLRYLGVTPSAASAKLRDA